MATGTSKSPGVGQVRRSDLPFIDVSEFGPVGTADDGPTLRSALASGQPLKFSRQYIVAPDPESYNEGGSFYAWSIKIPSYARLFFDGGAQIKQAAGAGIWTRTVSFQDANDVVIIGVLSVDANVAAVNATTNEHMHGVFFYDSVDIYIDAIKSINARGDNILIGGTDPDGPRSENIHIGSINCAVAGRKNLVLQHCNNVCLGDVILDNSAGGSGIYTGGTPDGTDKHCFDFEPDGNYSSLVVNRIRSLTTYGLGNDFSAGTTPAHADNCVLDIGTIDHVQSESSATVPSWIQYGITINAGRVSLINLAGMDESFQMLYASRLNVLGDLIIDGASATSTKEIARLSYSGADTNFPILNVGGRMIVRNSVGWGVESLGVQAKVQTLEVECVGIGLSVQDPPATPLGYFSIDEFVSTNSGVPSTGPITRVLDKGTLTIGRYSVTDTRGTVAGAIVQIWAGCAARTTIGGGKNLNSVPVAIWVSTDTYFLVFGGGYLASMPGYFVCQGTPESLIPAHIGSIAVRLDGGASTTMYVKESGTSTTGWVAK